MKKDYASYLKGKNKEDVEYWEKYREKGIEAIEAIYAHEETRTKKIATLNAMVDDKIAVANKKGDLKASFLDPVKNFLAKGTAAGLDKWEKKILGIKTTYEDMIDIVNEFEAKSRQPDRHDMADDLRELLGVSRDQQVEGVEREASEARLKIIQDYFSAKGLEEENALKAREDALLREYDLVVAAIDKEFGATNIGQKKNPCRL